MGSYQLNWRPLRAGHIAIGHRPGRRLREALDQSGCTHRLSLLSHRESTKAEGPSRIRLPLDTANPPSSSRTEEVLAVFERVKAVLDEGGRLYIHCSAGLHRTGMITHALLRFLGHSREDALALLTALRPLTAQEVKTRRLDWGEQFAAHSS